MPEEGLKDICGVDCSISDLCEKCRRRKAEFCKNYHLVNSLRWFSIISRKFFKTKLDWLIDDVALYSSYDLEVILREMYEKVYKIICDSVHDFWEKKIIKKYITNIKKL